MAVPPVHAQEAPPSPNATPSESPTPLAPPTPAASPTPVASPHPESAGSKPTARRWERFRLIIPGIGLDTLVVRGVDDGTLRAGPGHDPLSDRPGERGNCVLAAHRNVHGAPFWYLTKLTPNALVLVETARETLIYKVAFARLVAENETGLLERPTNPRAAPQLTLYTCTLPKSTDRFIVVASLIERQPASALSLDREAMFPTVTSGPLHLLKDPELRKRLKLPPLPPKSTPAKTTMVSTPLKRRPYRVSRRQSGRIKSRRYR